MSRVQGERFVWSELRPQDEPGRHRGFWIGVVGSLVLGTPWWAAWLPADSRVVGLPTWVVLVLAAAVLLSTTVAVSALLWWRDRAAPELSFSDQPATEPGSEQP